jgi:pyrimidine deaminase RibD-like protein
MKKSDREYMMMAIEEARKCKSPNPDDPKVGAVVVTLDGKVATAFRGERDPNQHEHAEYLALEWKLPDESLIGATVYTTLEPCTERGFTKHGKKKIPCNDRLIDRHVGRVFIGMIDPDPRIQGKAFRALQRSNITVQLFDPDLTIQVQELNRNFTYSRDQPRQEPSPPAISPVPSGSRAANASNPKPVRLGNFVFNDLFVMAGDFGEEFEFGCKYQHIPMQIPDSLKPLVSDLVSRVEKKARDEGQMYFNGPNTRLLRVTHERAHQASSGKEDPGYVLELAPISWEEYCVLHNF